jgi:hypothetical protein
MESLPVIAMDATSELESLLNAADVMPRICMLTGFVYSRCIFLKGKRASKASAERQPAGLTKQYLLGLKVESR